jgi:hypothetical protein
VTRHARFVEWIAPKILVATEDGDERRLFGLIGERCVEAKAIVRFKDRIRELTGRHRGLNLERMIGGAWASIVPDRSAGRLRIGFIDGVRRIDSRLFTEDTNRTAPASPGRGRSVSHGRIDQPTIGPVRVDRELVVGGELKRADLRTPFPKSKGDPAEVDGRD